MPKTKSTKEFNLFILITIFVGVLAIILFIWQRPSLNPFIEAPTADPMPTVKMTEIEVVTIADGLNHPWDIKVSDDGTFYVTQRGTGLYKLGENMELKPIYLPDDLYPAGEGGMLGFDLSPDFTDSREIYACFNSQKNEDKPKVIVARLKLNENFTNVISRKDIITEIESANSGRHSGCRVRFDPNEQDIIWITTGDAANGKLPQDPNSLNGKVLRVNREGEGVEGNLKPPFDPRIFSYGHRNIQGITLLPEFSETFGYGLTAEHGPDVDDEINAIMTGNFGWNPKLPYNESVPMTDKQKYPEAISALWSSEKRTIAACGIEYIKGEDWGEWEGDILQAALKDQYILKFEVNDNGTLEEGEKVVTDYGRIRQIYQAPNGKIYFTTDNGGDDIIGEISLK